MIKALNFFKFAVMVTIFAVVGVSCSSDDPDEPNPDPNPDQPGVVEPDVNLAKALAGSYKDVMHCSVMAQKFEFADVDVVIEANADGTINMNIEEFGSQPMSVPALKIEKMAVAEKNGVIEIQPTHLEGNAPFNGNYLPYTGSVKGSSKDGILTLDLSLSFGSMPAMICTYTATKSESAL